MGYFLARHALEKFFSTHRFLEKLVHETLHELNIPVATIRANAQMIGKNLPPKEKKRLERILQATDRLVALYDELDYFIKREVREPEKTTVEISRVLRERLAFFEERFQGREVIVEMEPCTAILDKRGLVKALDNLLANALKYSPAGTPLVVRCRNKVLEVRDKGIGIDPDQLVKVFERYYQGEKGSGGYGIGLGIVKNFCDENGVGVRVESVKGEGSAFFLDFSSATGLPEPALP